MEPRPRKKMPRWGESLWSFMEATKLHGLRYLGQTHLHWVERLFWAVVIVVGWITSYELSNRAFHRYQNSPTVIGIGRNYRNWIIEVPAITVCFVDRMNITKAHRFIEDTWNAKPGGDGYQKYEDFLNAVTNVSYDNLEAFQKFSSHNEFTKFRGLDLVLIARRLKNDIDYFTANELYMDFYEVATENGFCYTYAGSVPYHLSWKMEKPPPYEVKSCRFVTPYCGLSLEQFPAEIMVYVHPTQEIPDVNTHFEVVPEETELDANFRFLPVTYTSELKHLSVEQRKCRFHNEPDSANYSFYTYNLCRMNCRKKLMIDRCGCLPHFYAPGVSLQHNICDVQGLSCVAREKDDILRLVKKHDNCSCYPSCQITEYMWGAVQVTKWQFPAPSNIVFRWSLNWAAKTKIVRSVKFGLIELIAEMGGAGALFFSGSAVTIAEAFNFLFLKKLWKYLKNRQARRRRDKSIKLKQRLEVKVRPLMSRFQPFQ